MSIESAGAPEVKIEIEVEGIEEEEIGIGVGIEVRIEEDIIEDPDVELGFFFKF